MMKVSTKRPMGYTIFDSKGRVEKSGVMIPADIQAGKYFGEVKSVAPSPTDATDHNGKYFQSISEGKPTIEKC
jgi:hypothetical protein